MVESGHIQPAIALLRGSTCGTYYTESCVGPSDSPDALERRPCPVVKHNPNSLVILQPSHNTHWAIPALQRYLLANYKKRNLWSWPALKYCPRNGLKARQDVPGRSYAQAERHACTGQDRLLTNTLIFLWFLLCSCDGPRVAIKQWRCWQ
jgi:hypothetical protein